MVSIFLDVMQILLRLLATYTYILTGLWTLDQSISSIPQYNIE